MRSELIPAEPAGHFSLEDFKAYYWGLQQICTLRSATEGTRSALSEGPMARSTTQAAPFGLSEFA